MKQYYRGQYYRGQYYRGQYYRGQYYRGYIQSVIHSYYTRTVKVCHFESLTLYTGVAYQKHAKPVLLKQVTIPYSIHL